MNEVTVSVFSLSFGVNVRSILAEFQMDGMDLYRPNKYSSTHINSVYLLISWLC
jgi:hypothetical protein